jgi:hypothetical protein
LAYLLQFRQTREHHAAHVAGWSRTSTSASLSTCAGGKFSFERASSCRSRSAGRRVEVGGTTTSELFRRGAPVEARWAGLCSIVRLATAFSRGQGLGSADRLWPLQFRSSETPSYCTATGSWTTPLGARGTPCTTGSAVQNGSTTDDSHVLFSTGRLGLFQLQRWARRGRSLCSVPLRRCRPVRVSGAGVFMHRGTPPSLPSVVTAGLQRGVAWAVRPCPLADDSRLRQKRQSS